METNIIILMLWTTLVYIIGIWTGYKTRDCNKETKEEKI